MSVYERAIATKIDNSDGLKSLTILISQEHGTWRENKICAHQFKNKTHCCEESSMYMKSRYYLISFFELCFDRLMIFVQIEHINHVTGGQLSTRIYHLKAIEIVCPFFFGFVDVIEFQTPANMLFADFN